MAEAPLAAHHHVSPGHSEGKAMNVEVGAAFLNVGGLLQRDMTVACLRAVIHDKGGLAPPIHVLDALSGTGLRAIRMALEVPDVSSVHANEGLPSSFRTLERNLASHARAVSDAGARLETTMLEAGLMMSTAGRRYHFVDVDPCGSPAELLHGALACLCDGGVLSACFFDLQSLTGTGAAASTCFPKYGSMPLTPRQGRGFEREAAVRIATHAVMRHAEEQGMGIEPLLCVYCETCVRVVVRVSVAQGEAGVDGLVQAGADADRPFMSNGGSSTRSLAEMDQCTDGIGGEERGGGEKGGSGGRGGGRGGGTGVGRSIRVHACSLCPSYTIQDAATGLPHPLAECQQCSTKGQGEVGGPMWGGELCSPSFVENLVKQTSSLSTGTRIAALATSCASEHMCTPLFSDIYAVFAAFGVPSPPRDAVMDALRRAGLKCTVSHASATGIKTSGDASVVYDLARVWMEGRPGGFQQGGNVVARRKRRECQQGGGIFAHMTYHKLFGKEIGGRDDEEEANRVCGDQSTVFAGSLTEREVRDSDFDVDDVGCGAAEGWGSTRNASGESRREIGKRKEGCGTGQGVGMNRRQRRALMKQAAGQTGSEPGNGDESIIIGDKQAMDGRGDAEIAYAGPNSVATLPGNGKVEESIGSSGATGDAAGVTRRVEAGGSISQILSCARHGDTIVVASGRFEETVTVSKRVTLDGGNGAAVIVGTLKMRCAGGMVKGMRVEGRGRHGVDVVSGACRFERCVVGGGDGAGFIVSGGANTVLDGCRVEAGAGGGVYVCGKGAVAMAGCVVSGRGLAGVEVRGGGRVSMEGCRVEQSSKAGLYVHSGGGLQASDCTVSCCGFAGVECVGTGRAKMGRCRVEGGKRGAAFVHSGGRLLMERCDVGHGCRMAAVHIKWGGACDMVTCNITGGGQAGVFVEGEGSMGRLRDNCAVEGNGSEGLRVENRGVVATRLFPEVGDAVASEVGEKATKAVVTHENRGVDTKKTDTLLCGEDANEGNSSMDGDPRTVANGATRVSGNGRAQVVCISGGRIVQSPPDVEAREDVSRCRVAPS